MPESHGREYEAKFQVASDLMALLHLPTLSLDGYTVQTIGTITQTDTYMDTTAYDLLRHGLAMRVRHVGSAYEVGIKSIEATRNGVIQDRMDVSFPLPSRAQSFDASIWPTEVREHLAPYAIKGKNLRPLVVLRQRRQKAHIYLADSEQPLAEWSLDEVWIGTEVTDTNESDTIRRDLDTQQSFLRHFHELEIELLVPGNEQGKERATQANTNQEIETVFTALVAQVQERFKLTPIYTSKFVRALETSLAQAHDNALALTPTMELEAGGRLLLHQQLLQILLNEHGVRTRKKAIYVHEMRVAIRRGRAAMQLCAIVFPSGALIPFQNGLKRLGRALGIVRDLDVALANLRAFSRSQPEEQRQGIKLLRKELKKRRAEAHAELMALFESKKYRKFVRKLLAFCTMPPMPTELGKADKKGKSKPSKHFILPSQVRHTVPSSILRAFEAVRAYETSFSDDLLPALEVFHALRIQTKYLRYLLEFAQPLLGNAGEQLEVQLRELQEHLGKLNDAHVEQERLHLWAEKAHEDIALSEAIAERLTQVATTLNELATTVPARFGDFISHPNRQKLASALVHI